MKKFWNFLKKNIIPSKVMCSKSGSAIEWRQDLPVCAKQCKGDFVYSACAAQDERARRGLPSNSLDDFHAICVGGCVCGEGLYLDKDNHCVPKDKCHCYHQGMFYQAGQELLDQDGYCICKSGKMVCSSSQDEQLKCRSDQIYYSCSNDFETGAERGLTCLNRHLPFSHSSCKTGCACPDDLGKFYFCKKLEELLVNSGKYWKF